MLRGKRAKLHCPELGELVSDLAHGGKVGAYMGTEGGEVYLRRPSGGCEWTTDPGSIEPVELPAGSAAPPVTGAA
ncbi:hypothetical protein SAMN05216371_5686 [Streptomyces sp. TLI_053]|nr:hypothetical protein SAMN05216371_5686 [Streptomyces sp. TLI_053]